MKVSELNFEEPGQSREGGTSQDYSRMKDAVLKEIERLQGLYMTIGEMHGKQRLIEKRAEGGGTTSERELPPEGEKTSPRPFRSL